MAGYYNKDSLMHNQWTQVTEVLSVNCRRCGNIWKEEHTHRGTLAGYVRTYDYCSKCKRVGE